MQETFITALRLSHFRSYKQFEHTFENRPVVLFGANGAGKTNILEAISLLSPGRGLRRATLSEIARTPENLGWKIKAHLMRHEQGHELSLRYAPPKNKEITIDDKAAPSSALAHLSAVLWLTPNMDRLWIEGAEGRRRFLDRITLSLFPEHAENALGYEKAMRERNRLLKDGVRDGHWYDAVERQMAITGEAIQYHRRATLREVITAQDTIGAAFPKGDFELTQGECEFEEDQEGLQSCLARMRSQDSYAGRTLAGPHRCDLNAKFRLKDMSAAASSTGEQKALLLSMVLANARALQNRNGQTPLLLFDEVSAHLDQKRRAALYEEIEALNAQAWLTGTDRALFAELESSAQFLEISEQDGISTIVQP